jgi:outer membrane receptor protein involved in Fe transport
VLEPASRRRWLRACAVLVAAWAFPALAETSGSVRGLVTDDGGLPIEAVTITVSSAAQHVAARGALTDEEGRFQIGTLPPGLDYQIGAVFPGFASVTLTDIEVVAGQAALVHITLQKQSAALQEKIQVKAAAPVISLQETTTQSRFTAEFIDALPLLGRNYQDLLALAPGVSDVDGDGNPNIHGARDTDVITLVDGVSTTDPLTGKIGAQLNIESIQEIEVKTSGATAEFSRAQGGFANIITKSGGNQFEGTFKIYVRTSRLDGDGAGIDDPRLHAGLGENGLRNLSFSDLMPFLSLSGPIAKDHAWFFIASEYVKIQDPVNALNVAFVAEQREFREFAKLTWQVSPNHRLALSLNYDPQEFLNQGLTSFTRVESGFTVKQGGPIITAKWVGILSPNVSLDTSVSSFDERPSRVGTLNPDTNGNGYLFTDRNGNGFVEASEYDAGEDYDQDGAFDVFEDSLHRNNVLDPGEDRDRDGRLTLSGRPGSAGGCEGRLREDLDCDGRLDNIDEDPNGNGHCDPGEPCDIDADGILERGTEDRNHNNSLDDRPFMSPTDHIPDANGNINTSYPYGEQSPAPQDRFYTIDQRQGITSGPYYQNFSDSRRRFTVRQDLTVFVPDYYGSHDLKMGVVLERENFDRTTDGRPIAAPLLVTPQEARRGLLSTVRAIIPAETEVQNTASALTGGIYIQDSYKPFPNLSFGLGLRFDREATDSFGYTFFDPAAQRAQFDRLNILAGGERGVTDDLAHGNNDGILSQGVYGDPLFFGSTSPDQALAFIVNPLQVAALSRMTRHHTATGFVSQQLGTLFPEILQGGEVSAARLLSLGVQPQREEPFRITNNNLSPRLSVAWDPLSDGRTKIFSTWGRYYDKLFLNTIVGEEGPDSINRYYLYDRAGVTGNGTPDHQIGSVLSKAPPSATQIDRGLQTPFSDEFTFGFERELAPEVALRLTWVQRNYRAQLQDIDVNHTIRINPATGQPVDQLGLLPANFQSGGARLPDHYPDLFIDNFFFNQVLRVGNYNSSVYHGIELEVIKRLSRRWEMQASYVYSRALGSAEDFQSKLGNDPSTVQSEYGYLDFDQRHVVKLNAGVYLPHDWQMGLTASWGSGLPYSVISRFFALDNVDYQQFRTLYGYTVPTTSGSTVTGYRFQPETRDSRRNAAAYDFGIHARKTFVVGRNTAGLFLDVFNLLNTDTLRISTYEPVPPQFAGSGETGTQGPLQINGTRQFGRRWQIGFQYNF